MKDVSDAYKMADDYVKQVYPWLKESSNQFKESQQHFLMGIWAALQLLKNDKFTKKMTIKLDSELREYQKARLESLKSGGV